MLVSTVISALFSNLTVCLQHMDDRGTPINRTPSIGTSDVDLYRLFKLVQRLGGQNRQGL